MDDRGARRRRALVDAAAGLTVASGPDAVTARAVAAVAGVPLAAVTYYFTDVAELAREAAAQVVAEHVASARLLRGRLRRGASDRVLADRLVTAVLGPYTGAGTDGLAALYERSLAAARRPGWGALLAHWDTEVRGVVAELLGAAGRPAGSARWVLACLDGLAVSAVVRGVPDPRADVVAALADVLPLLTASRS